jgi:hypothetical protein
MIPFQRSKSLSDEIQSFTGSYQGMAFSHAVESKQSYGTPEGVP